MNRRHTTLLLAALTAALPLSSCVSLETAENCFELQSQCLDSGKCLVDATSRGEDSNSYDSTDSQQSSSQSGKNEAGASCSFSCVACEESEESGDGDGGGDGDGDLESSTGDGDGDGGDGDGSDGDGGDGDGGDGDGDDAGSEPECEDLGELETEEREVRLSVEGVACFIFDAPEIGMLSVDIDDNDGAHVVSVFHGEDESPTASRSTAKADLAMPLEASDDGYRVEITGEGKFSMTLEFEEYEEKAPEQDPGNVPEDALPLGAASSAVEVVGGYVGVLDDADFYHVEVGQCGVLTLKTSGVIGGVRMSVFQDAALIDTKSPKFALTAADEQGSTISMPVASGAYVLRMEASGSWQDPVLNHHLYQLQWSVEEFAGCLNEATDDDDSADATDLGAIGLDLVSQGGYVGTLDDADYYRFSLNEDADLSLHLLDIQGGVRAQVFASSTVIDETMPLFVAQAADAQEAHHTEPLAAGDYVVRLAMSGTWQDNTLNNALYTLALEATPTVP